MYFRFVFESVGSSYFSKNKILAHSWVFKKDIKQKFSLSSGVFCVINRLLEPSGIKIRISRAQVREIGNDNNM